MDYEGIIFPEGFTEEQKEYWKKYLRWEAEKIARLCVIYNPDCGCNIDVFVTLDRYPMSPKIMTLCNECKKGCLLEITDPIKFYLPMTKQDFSLEEMANMYITETDQKYFIQAYIAEWKMNNLANQDQEK